MMKKMMDKPDLAQESPMMKKMMKKEPALAEVANCRPS
jgi:hypothetical protein